MSSTIASITNACKLPMHDVEAGRMSPYAVHASAIDGHQTFHWLACHACILLLPPRPGSEAREEVPTFGTLVGFTNQTLRGVFESTRCPPNPACLQASWCSLSSPPDTCSPASTCLSANDSCPRSTSSSSCSASPHSTCTFWGSRWTCSWHRHGSRCSATYMGPTFTNLTNVTCIARVRLTGHWRPTSCGSLSSK